MNDVVSFWHTEEHWSFLPVDTIILGLLSQACLKYLKFAYLCNVSRNTWRMKLIFCLQINPDIVYKLIVSHWMCVARHTKLPKITSLQYLCSISRKMWRMKLIFLPADKHQRFLYKTDTIILGVCGHAR